MTTSLIHFTLVVPTFTAHDKLRFLLDTLLPQTHEHWTLLVVDKPTTEANRLSLLNLIRIDPRISLIDEDPVHPSIYGAMNKGLRHIPNPSWVLFLGSDDLLSQASTLADLAFTLSGLTAPPSIVFTAASYTGSKGLSSRSVIFGAPGSLSNRAYRLRLLFGLVPAHQACLFNSSTLRTFEYRDNLRLAADLDLILQYSRHPQSTYLVSDLHTVLIDPHGISSQHHFRRLAEVFSIYLRYFKFLVFAPFLLRYIRKIFSI